MTGTLEDRTLALAGIFQAAKLVREIAHSGRPQPDATQASISSLFKIDAKSTIDVYGGLEYLKIGLETLREQLDNRRSADRDLELTRYVVALLYLERKLSRNKQLLEHLSRGIARAKEQSEYFTETHTNVISSLAQIYQETISTLTPRIMVTGNQELLSQQEHANMIRVLLLSGIRSAVLWRQKGGNRWHILFSRQKYLKTGTRLLEQIYAPRN